MAEDNLLFCRSSDDTPHDELWDDTALIKAYDKAINKAKAEVAKRMGLEDYQSTSNSTGTKSKQKTKSQKNQKRWCQGAPCRAIYSEDGKLYEATIMKVFDDSKSCIVKFIGYENIEKVDMASLLESEGLQSQIAQQKQAEGEAEAAEQNSNNSEHESPTANGYQENEMEYEASGTKSFKNMYNNPSYAFNPNMGPIPPAPPLPPSFMARLPENDADALSSMLMSWYISGFHTGYYHGMKQAQSSQGRKRK